MKLKRASLVTKITILAIIVFAAISLVSINLQITQAQQKRDSLQKEVDSAMQTNTELQYAIDHSTDEETIEDIARGKLGLVKPGEKIFFDASN